MKGEGDCRTVSFVLATIVGSKNKNIHLRDFKDVDFNFTHFANFKFAYFEIEESFGLIWVKLQNGRFHLQISILGARFKYRLYFCSFCVLRKFWTNLDKNYRMIH